MHKNLFEIEQSMMNLLEYGIDDETGEIVESEEEFNKLYDSIQLDLNTKLDNSNCMTKILDGEIEVIDKEIKRLQSEKKARERKREWLFNRVDNFIRRQFTDEEGNINLEGLNKYKLELPHSKISYRKSEKVNVIDETQLPTEFVKVTVEKKPMLTEIKKAIKEGNDISGATLVQNVSMQLK